MSYKYHVSAIVFNEHNLIRLWDISYDGYVGSKDTSILDWGSDNDVSRFIRADNNLALPLAYGGPSIVVLPLPTTGYQGAHSSVSLASGKLGKQPAV